MNDRSKFIGGSDAAGILNRSSRDTMLSIWAEKTGQYIPPEGDNEAAELGKELEDYVARRFERKTGKKLKPLTENREFVHETYPFLVAHVDRLIDGEEAGLECKTASAWKASQWKDDQTPPEYEIQCYHYMMVTGLKKWYLACLIGNQSFVIREFLWDNKIIKALLDREVSFWKEFVETGIMPMTISYKDTDVLKGIFPEAMTGENIMLPDEVNQIVETLIANKEDQKNLENIIEQNENLLKAYLKEAESGQTSRYKVKWSNMKINKLDSAEFKRQCPDLFRLYSREKIQRRFSYKTIGEKDE